MDLNRFAPVNSAPPAVPVENKSGFKIGCYQTAFCTPANVFYSFVPWGRLVGRKNYQLYIRSIGTFGEIARHIRLTMFCC